MEAQTDKVKELTNGDFDDFIKGGLVLIDFTADWCMPCLIMSPIMEDLSEKFKGKIVFGKINVEEETEIARKFDVSSLPNFILFKDGSRVDQFIGSMPSEDFEEKLEKHL